MDNLSIIVDAEFEFNKRTPHDFLFMGDSVVAAVDYKNRAIIPFEFRKYLPNIKNGKKEKKLIYFIVEEANEEKILGKLVCPLVYADISKEKLLIDREFFRRSYRLELDKQGRVQLPDYLKGNRYLQLIPEGDRIIVKRVN